MLPTAPPNHRRRRGTAALVAAALLIPLAPITLAVGAATANAAAPAMAYRNPQLSVDKRATDLLGRMTLAEKVGQMTQAERADATAAPLVTTLSLGSVLSGGGSVPTPNTPAAWADMIDGFQKQALSTRLGIPIIYGVDAVHGHGNLNGATISPTTSDSVPPGTRSWSAA